MHSHFTYLSRQDERLTKNWQTIQLQATPLALGGFARVVDVIQRVYLSDQWEHWREDGSISFRHKKNDQWVVKVWVDHEGKLSSHFGLSFPPTAIVVGVDLIDYDPAVRFSIRQLLRDEFRRNYVDPELGPLPIAKGMGRKVSLMPDYKHALDIAFVPPAPCEAEIDEDNVAAILNCITEKSATW